MSHTHNRVQKINHLLLMKRTNSNTFFQVRKKSVEKLNSSKVKRKLSCLKNSTVLREDKWFTESVPGFLPGRTAEQQYSYQAR